MGVYIGHAALNVTNLDVRVLQVLVRGGVYHTTTGNWKACLSLFLFERNDRYNEQKKYKRDDNLSEKQAVTLSHFFIRILRNNFSGRLSVCRYVRLKHLSLKFQIEFAKWSGASQK